MYLCSDIILLAGKNYKYVNVYQSDGVTVCCNFHMYLQKFRSFLLLFMMMMMKMMVIIIIIIIHSVVFLPGCVVLQLKFPLVLYTCVSTFFYFSTCILCHFVSPHCLWFLLWLFLPFFISSFLYDYYFGHC